MKRERERAWWRAWRELVQRCIQSSDIQLLGGIFQSKKVGILPDQGRLAEVLEKLGWLHFQLPLEGGDSPIQFGLNGDKAQQKRGPFVQFFEESVVYFFGFSWAKRSCI